MHIPTFNIIRTANVLLSFLEVDCDQAAERIQIFDRKTGSILRHLPTRPVKKLQITLPVNYSVGPTLMCVILDDNDEFNAYILDRVEPMLINIFQFDPTNPLPYEPPSA